jgi:hypothetical protein
MRSLGWCGDIAQSLGNPLSTSTKESSQQIVIAQLRGTGVDPAAALSHRSEANPHISIEVRSGSFSLESTQRMKQKCCGAVE